MTTLLESLEAKAQADAVYEMTLEELIAWWGSRKYSPVGQATLNYLERLQGLTPHSAGDPLMSEPRSVPSNLRLSDGRVLECIAYLESYQRAPGTAMADTILALRELQEWRAGCTGRHGSQMACVSGDSSAHAETKAIHAPLTWELFWRQVHENHFEPTPEDLRDLLRAITPESSEETKQDAGIPHPRCNYLAPTDGVCNKCGWTDPKERKTDCGNPVMIGTEAYGPCTRLSGHEGECSRETFRQGIDRVRRELHEHSAKGLVSAGSSAAVNPRETVGGCAEPSGQPAEDYCVCGRSKLAKWQNGYYCTGCGKDLHPDNYLPENGKGDV